MEELFIYVVIFGTLFGVFGGAAILVWFERRLLGIWQDRLGPNRVGPFGIGLALADIIKLFAKEDWIPPFADRFVFVFAPTAIVMAMLLGFAVVPYAPGVYIANLNIGLLFFLGMTSLAVYSVLLGGLASNNKYALLGGLRSAAQMISYEVFMGLSLM
ncbi:MAG: NADH-quinone oxidoreductase subunit H, partial [bacterium]